MAESIFDVEDSDAFSPEPIVPTQASLPFTGTFAYCVLEGQVEAEARSQESCSGTESSSDQDVADHTETKETHGN